MHCIENGSKIYFTRTVNIIHQMVVINLTISYYYFFFRLHFSDFNARSRQWYFLDFFPLPSSFSPSSSSIHSFFLHFILFVFYFPFVLWLHRILHWKFTLFSSDSISYYYEFSKEQDYICTKPEDSGMHQCSALPPYRIGPMICNGKYMW